MWKSCLSCISHLGSNEEIENFPIGARLVFDPRKGRLWVICPKCERWNLTPIEERWEAVEELERKFRSSAAKYTGSDVGIARLRSGLEIIRVGAEPTPLEFAAWRWAMRSRVGRMNPLRRFIESFRGNPLAIHPVMWLMQYASPEVSRWGVRSLRQADLVRAGVSPRNDELGWAVDFKQYSGDDFFNRAEGLAPAPWAEYTGEAAVAILRRCLPRMNFGRSRERRAPAAVELVAESGGIEGFMKVAASSKPRWVQLRHYPRELALAMEMALHENEERRALDGELHRLRRAWARAEEIAAISDDLILPPSWYLLEEQR